MNGKKLFHYFCATFPFWDTYWLFEKCPYKPGEKCRIWTCSAFHKKSKIHHLCPAKKTTGLQDNFQCERWCVDKTPEECKYDCQRYGTCYSCENRAPQFKGLYCADCEHNEIREDVARWESFVKRNTSASSDPGI